MKNHPYPSILLTLSFLFLLAPAGANESDSFTIVSGPEGSGLEITYPYNASDNEIIKATVSRVTKQKVIEFFIAKRFGEITIDKNGLLSGYFGKPSQSLITTNSILRDLGILKIPTDIFPIKILIYLHREKEKTAKNLTQPRYTTTSNTSSVVTQSGGASSFRCFTARAERDAFIGQEATKRYAGESQRAKSERRMQFSKSLLAKHVDKELRRYEVKNCDYFWSNSGRRNKNLNKH